MLTYLQRKRRLPFGAGRKVSETEGVVPSYVTAVLKGESRNRRVESALAVLMVPPTTVEEAFGDVGPEAVHKTAVAAMSFE